MFERFFKKRSEPRADFNSLDPIDESVLRKYFASTNPNLRLVPLLVAQQVQNELELEILTNRSIDQRRLSEIAGGLQALHRFSRLLHDGVEGWVKKAGGEDA